MHRIEGAEALERYFATLYSNVTKCRFDFHERQRSGQEAFAAWTLHLAHPRLAGGREYAVEGCSRLTFADDDSGRVARHRDYFDAGALLYERLPLLGGAILGGAVGGPLSYYAGAELAGVSLAPWLLPVQALVWAGLCLWLCRRLSGAVARV